MTSFCSRIYPCVCRLCRQKVAYDLPQESVFDVNFHWNQSSSLVLKTYYIRFFYVIGSQRAYLSPDG